jgi:hypothetical protein
MYLEEGVWNRCGILVRTRKKAIKGQCTRSANQTSRPEEAEAPLQHGKSLADDVNVLKCRIYSQPSL